MDVLVACLVKVNQIFSLICSSLLDAYSVMDMEWFSIE
jgi:hypothetical protein